MTITRYNISKMATELSDRQIRSTENRFVRARKPEELLKEGCVLDWETDLEEIIEGTYKTIKEAEEALHNYKTEITKNSSYIYVEEHYLFERTYDLDRIIEDNDDINSEEDFDEILKNTKKPYDFEYIESEAVVGISPMRIGVLIAGETSNQERVIIFNNYSDAEIFIKNRFESLKERYLPEDYFAEITYSLDDYIEIEEDDIKDMFSFEKKVRHALIDLDMTAAQLATRLGISSPYLSDLLKGKRKNEEKIEEIKRICKIK